MYFGWTWLPHINQHSCRHTRTRSIVLIFIHDTPLRSFSCGRHCVHSLSNTPLGQSSDDAKMHARRRWGDELVQGYDTVAVPDRSELHGLCGCVVADVISYTLAVAAPGGMCLWHSTGACTAADWQLHAGPFELQAADVSTFSDACISQRVPEGMALQHGVPGGGKASSAAHALRENCVKQQMLATWLMQGVPGSAVPQRGRVRGRFEYAKQCSQNAFLAITSHLLATHPLQGVPNNGAVPQRGRARGRRVRHVESI